MNKLKYYSYLLAFIITVSGLSIADANEDIGEIIIAIPVGDYDIRTDGDGHRLYLENYGNYLIPGKPRLPSRIFSIAIPPGTEYAGLECSPGEPVVLTERLNIPPAPLTRVIGDENPQLYADDLARYDRNFKSVYETDSFYPETIVSFERTAGYRKYNLVDIRVTPFRYNPVTQQVSFYPDISLTIKLTESDKSLPVIIDNLPRTEKNASDIIFNYSEAAAWYPQLAPSGKDLFDFVIITTPSLVSSVDTLVSWETLKGRNVNVVTTDWIYANYLGYDYPEQIRNFLRDKYPSAEWGIEDVLIVGHYDNVPMRRVAQDIGYGMPETDFYYAELTSEDDYSWDADNDHQWCEESDPIDFYAEVNVGRIPWSNPTIVQNICRKTVAYELNQDASFKKNILLLGAFFWDNDPNPRTDNAVLMEAKVDQPWMTDWTMTRLYESGYSSYPMDYDLNNGNVVSVWSSGTYAFVNWAGHGSPTSSHVYHNGMPAFITSGNCPSLNDNYPAIIFADACSNSDTDNLNIGQAMMQQGAVAFEGATKVALGCPGWNDMYDGSSQSLDYFYTTYITSGDYTVGAALMRALREMYVYGLWSYNKYETCEWGALWGSPNLYMGEIIQQPLEIVYPDGLPEDNPPGEPITITVQINDLTENYIPGTGTIYYRYSDQIFHSLELIHLNDNQYQAVMPQAYCDARPEFYFSAQGDGGSIVLDPQAAPVDYYSLQIGIPAVAMSDDFETDQGWTVNGNAVDGHWQRGVPAGGGDRGDPPADFDGSGQCYVTDNADDNSDVDDGSTFLISPTLDLSEGDAAISYALWYSNNTGDNPNADYFVVWISNNNGSSWVPVDSIGPASANTWSEYSYSVDEYIAPTANIKVRFEASDLGGGSVVEAAVDAFRVERIECENPGYSYLPGDANMYNADWPPAIIGGDVTYLVNYFRNIPAAIACYLDGFWASADANGDCQVIGSDVTRLVNYFRDVGDMQYCPDFEPLWLSPDDLPDGPPTGWPGCE